MLFPAGTGPISAKSFKKAQKNPLFEQADTYWNFKNCNGEAAVFFQRPGMALIFFLLRPVRGLSPAASRARPRVFLPECV